MTLREYTLNQMNISGITMAAISKNGLGNVSLVSASEDGKKLSLIIGVQSSVNDNKHVDLKGNPQPFLKREYAVRLEFININKVVPNNWTQQNDQTIAQYLQQIYNKCDVKIACDCPSFYWQGMHEGDAEKKTSYFDFMGTHGKGIWNARHAGAGGNIGQQMCKHVYNASKNLVNLSSEIIQQIKKTPQQNVKESILFDNILKITS